jgi:hypothetical protein
MAAVQRPPTTEALPFPGDFPCNYSTDDILFDETNKYRPLLKEHSAGCQD